MIESLPPAKLILLLLAPALVAVAADFADPGKELNDYLAAKTQKRLQLTFELRQRLEDRTGIAFGRDRDIMAEYVRFRLGAIVRPVSWVKAVALLQDTRTAGYGLPAPGNVRDPHDLQEAYVELMSASQQGVGLTVGRQMIGYGDTRLIGSPQWAYAARTWDTARLYYVTAKARWEFLHISPIQTRGDAFNRPVLGDRIWGMYNTFKDAGGRKGSVTDVYLLRHDQNRAGGFTGLGSLGVNVFGSRWLVPLSKNWRAVFEGVLQNGHVGSLDHRAAGAVALAGYKTQIFKRALDSANEYKYASGTDPNSGRSGTFDQLYPAAHDKLGHVDLIGWRNVHNLRSVNTLTIRKGWTAVLMYNATWLANPRDALYNLQSRVIVRSPNGGAGRWVGQEVDLFSNWQWQSFIIGGGVGRFIPGTFIKRTTPAPRSHLIYLTTSYTF
ncbi:MAG: alginate export family protein [Bryobacterales bacterium]|nr:alginate export family protein [Bryobacterales bacterium]